MQETIQLYCKYLGKSCHYLQDLNAPHHTSNLIATNTLLTQILSSKIGQIIVNKTGFCGKPSNHREFESKVLGWIKNYLKLFIIRKSK